MRGGEVVDVEPDVFRPAVGYEVLISGKLALVFWTWIVSGETILSTLSLPTYMNDGGSTTLLLK